MRPDVVASAGRLLTSDGINGQNRGHGTGERQFAWASQSGYVKRRAGMRFLLDRAGRHERWRTCLADCKAGHEMINRLSEGPRPTVQSRWRPRAGHPPFTRTARRHEVGVCLCGPMSYDEQANKEAVNDDMVPTRTGPPVALEGVRACLLAASSANQYLIARLLGSTHRVDRDRCAKI